MAKISLNGRDLWSVVILFVVGAILMFLGMVAVGNQPEVYDDFIVETVAYRGSNMTGELKVFWAILCLGVPGLLLINRWLNKKNSRDKATRELSFAVMAELVISVASVIYVAVTGELEVGLILAGIIVFLNYLVNSEKQKIGLIFDILVYYALRGGATALNWVGVEFEIGGLALMIVAMILGLVVMYIDKKKNILGRAMLLLQVCVPLNLLAYVNERYTLDDEVIKMGFPLVVRVVFGVAIVAVMGWAAYRAVRKWRVAESASLSSLIALPTVMVIFVMNSVAANTGLVVPEDLHHTAEEVISYQQIFGKGQVAYVDYSPVSGLFPVFIGTVLELVGGHIAEFNIAHAMFMMVMAALTMWVLSRHLEKEDCMIVAMCFMFGSYDRAVWILLSLLLLFLPKLVKQRDLWLKVWILLVLVQGLYYPSFGGAVLIGTLPIGIWQAIQLVKSGELKNLAKKWQFYAGWVVVLGAVGACVPLLLNMARHIMIYSAQTNLADGIAVFGQKAPDNFLPYLSEGTLDYVRHAIYYALRYVIPMTAVWILSLVCAKCWKKRKEDWMPFWMTLASILTLVVAYTATMVRQDDGAIVSRAAYVIVPIFGVVFYVVIKRYLQNNMSSMVLLGVVIGTVLVLGCCPMAGLTDGVKYATELEGGYEEIGADLSDKIPRLGRGFMKSDDLKKFDERYEWSMKLLEYDPNLKFYGWGSFGMYYALDLTTVGQPSDYAAKSYATNDEIVDAIKTQKPVVGLYLSDTILNYYLYNWLMTNDEYVYDENFLAFLPRELFEKIYGDDAEPTAKDKVGFTSVNAGRVASSLGASLDSLKSVLHEPEVTVSIDEIKYDVRERACTYEATFSTVDGSLADMLYLDFDVNGWLHEPEDFVGLKQNYNDDVGVVVAWGNNRNERMSATMGRGDLLMPLGANATWLVNKHSGVTITVDNVDECIDLDNIKFYQLRKEL